MIETKYICDGCGCDIDYRDYVTVTFDHPTLEIIINPPIGIDKTFQEMNKRIFCDKCALEIVNFIDKSLKDKHRIKYYPREE